MTSYNCQSENGKNKFKNKLVEIRKKADVLYYLKTTVLTTNTILNTFLT